MWMYFYLGAFLFQTGMDTPSCVRLVKPGRGFVVRVEPVEDVASDPSEYTPEMSSFC